MRITFLGTAAARPTVRRNVSALHLQREGDEMLFDCGEGTQRQIMRFGTGFSFDDIFFSHLHADHYLGVIGLLRTMGLQDRQAPVRLWCAAGSEQILRDAVHLGVERVPFDVPIQGLRPGEAIERDGYRIEPFRTRHGRHSLGYAVVEDDRLGRFDPERARALGVPEGPLWGRLHRGEAVEVDGRTITPDELVGPTRSGRTFVYTGDTRPCASVVEAARDADLLVHEATFASDEKARAVATQHSTAREAADIARKAGVRQLVLTHFSPRYSEDPQLLEREARKAFPGAVLAKDGLTLEIAFRES